MCIWSLIRRSPSKRLPIIHLNVRKRSPRLRRSASVSETITNDHCCMDFWKSVFHDYHSRAVYGAAKESGRNERFFSEERSDVDTDDLEKLCKRGLFGFHCVSESGHSKG